MLEGMKVAASTEKATADPSLLYVPQEAVGQQRFRIYP